MLDVNVPENFKCIRTGFDKVIKKLSTAVSQLLKFTV